MTCDVTQQNVTVDEHERAFLDQIAMARGAHLYSVFGHVTLIHCNMTP